MADTKSGIQPATAVPANNYSPKSFSKNVYQVDSLSYPDDLMGNNSQYGSNYVIFYINVNNESKMVENADNLVAEGNLDEATKKSLRGKQIDAVKAGAAAAGGGILTGALGGSVVFGGIGKAIKGAIAGGVPGALGTAAVAANVNGKGPEFSRSKKRLKAAIALYVPNQLSIRYGAGWSDEETFGFNAFLKGGEAVARALDEGSTSAITDPKKGVAAIAGSFALQRGPSAAALSQLTGLAPNPMKEQIFKGVDFRTFTMEYQFAPRSREEARNVLNIINTFKYHMHPEYKDDNNFLFLYPSEFDVIYYHDGDENMNIHRHTSCVLTELNVNYTPNGNFSTFKEGIPSQINVSMSFKELTILTKELIAQGL
jgi:hypothetical protein